MSQVYACGNRNKKQYITKLFKNTDVKVAYITNNNIGKLLAMQTQKTNNYDGNGV